MSKSVEGVRRTSNGKDRMTQSHHAELSGIDRCEWAVDPEGRG